MKQGTIKMSFEENRMPLIEMQLESNNLWLTQNELARFFGVFVSKINAELNNIFKNNLLNEWDCIRYNRYIDKGLEKQTALYNLDVLIFLSYRIDSFEAKVFREFVKTALQKHLQPKLPGSKIVWLSFPNKSSCYLN